MQCQERKAPSAPTGIPRTRSGLRSTCTPTPRASRSARPDVLQFVNCCPLGLIELKHAADDGLPWGWLGIRSRPRGQNSRTCPPQALCSSTLCLGTLTAGRRWCNQWLTITGEALTGPRFPHLQVMLAQPAPSTGSSLDWKTVPLAVSAAAEVGSDPSSQSRLVSDKTETWRSHWAIALYDQG